MKTIFNRLGLFMLLFTVWSCEKQLNELPANQKVGESIIIDAKSAQVALNGIYYKFADCGIDYYDIPSTQACRYYQIIPTGLFNIIIDWQGAEFPPNAIRANDYSARSMWAYCYGVINAANGVITQMNRNPDIPFPGNRRNEIIGEATFLRAYGHYLLLRMFAHHFDYNSNQGVLLRTEPTNVDNIAKKRSNVRDSYQNILDDLNFAINNCPIDNPNYYVNKWIAKGLKIRVLMMRGQGTDYADAAGLALDIINNGPYDLENDVQDIFKTKGLRSNEVMFGIIPKPNQTSTLEQYYYYGAEYNPSDILLDILDGDPRESWVITDVDDELLITKYIDGDDLESDEVVESVYIMRLSEIYLLRAEALVRSGGNIAEAKQLVKDVMDKAGVTDFSVIDDAATNDELLLEITKEAIRSFFCENGLETEFMSRLPLTTLQTLFPFLSSKNYIVLPIPADEFRLNPTIGDQNEGYSKN